MVNTRLRRKRLLKEKLRNKRRFRSAVGKYPSVEPTIFLNKDVTVKERPKKKIAFGTFTLFNPPKPTDRVARFTVAFSFPIKKSVLYPKLSEVLGDHWSGEPTKSIFIRLINPPPWRKTRALIKKALEELLLEEKTKTFR